MPKIVSKLSRSKTQQSSAAVSARKFRQSTAEYGNNEKSKSLELDALQANHHNLDFFPIFNPLPYLPERETISIYVWNR